MELAVAVLIGYRANTIVPNVSWGLYLKHECDMLVLDKQNRFTEIEIKISKSDLKADFSKKHGHKSKIISRLVYAIPENLLETALELLPNDSGIIIVKYYNGYYKAFWHRHARHKKNTEEIPTSTINKFYQLGCMRIWSLKAHNNKRNGK